MAFFDFFRRKPKSLLDRQEELRLGEILAQAIESMDADRLLDVDRVPGGTGEFGLDVNNPVPCRSIADTVRYLGSLRAPDGTKLKCERTRSIYLQDTPGPVDEYEITHVSGAVLPSVYVSGYYVRNSTHAAVGYILVTPPWGKAPPEQIREESLRVAFKRLFPIFSDNQALALEFVDVWFKSAPAGADICAATFRIITFDVDSETGQRVSIDDIREQDVYVFQAPLPQGPSALSENVVAEISRRHGIATELLNEADGNITPQDLFPLEDFDVTDFWVPIKECRVRKSCWLAFVFSHSANIPP